MSTDLPARNRAGAARGLDTSADGDREPTPARLEARLQGAVVVEVELADGPPAHA